ncbi:hypothetical protein HBI56_032740 [Parastagonospora nodorum]|nr:hypothetical protein HBH56_020540 [Parastagonospora nodorum]KAH3937277.1 hypothetical protein HBH54_013970 [Parastagonospora nodorum]KAH3967644.1 hypothetical protein HBH51_137690 [Parastagonospora nodorum]KAH4006521.1 hypothetical protein HBI10_013890 [Parastagonospora nodorum]KAH4025623.1 hypothetical protein HBI13_067810 [Parastagonospora nodorum]
MFVNVRVSQYQKTIMMVVAAEYEWAILRSVSGSASLMTASSAILLYTAWPLPAGQHVYINTLPQTPTLSPPN